MLLNFHILKAESFYFVGSRKQLSSLIEMLLSLSFSHFTYQLFRALLLAVLCWCWARKTSFVDARSSRKLPPLFFNLSLDIKRELHFDGQRNFVCAYLLLTTVSWCQCDWSFFAAQSIMDFFFEWQDEGALSLGDKI